MSKRRLFLTMLAACAVLAWSVPASAQLTQAGIVGTVTDQSEAVLPGASVVVENTQTGATRSVTTDSEGRYVFNLLQTGSYTVRIEIEGFKPYLRRDVELAAGDRIRVDAQLEVGGATEVVEVVGRVAALQTDTATVGSLVTSTAVQDLPLRGRNYVELIQATPGANASVAGALSSGDRPDDRRQTSAVSVNGMTELVNNNMIDGMDNNERSIGTIGVKPSIDAIAEVRVQTNLYTAEVGRTVGGVINILTKSGTNDFHGSAFEFYRHESVCAKNFFAPEEKPKDRWHQFGASLGGPIVKNKTFFFADYEGLRVTTGRPSGLQTVPTLKMRQGDFSELLPGTVIYDQSKFPAEPFPGNIIPEINPIAANYIDLFPEPNIPGAGITNNYSTVNDFTQDTNTFDARIDHKIGEGDSLYLRYSFNDVTVYTPGLFPRKNGIDPGGAVFAFAGESKTKAHGVHLNYIHLMGPRTLLEVKAGYMRFNIDSNPLSLGTNASQEFGLQNINTEEKFSGLALAGADFYPTLGSDAFLPLIIKNNVYQGTVSLSHTRGAHDLKAGVGVILRNYVVDQSSFPLGWYSFTANPTATAPFGGTGGYSLASMMVGQPWFVLYGRTLGVLEYQTWEPSIYIQDDWRVNNWLSVNLGVRYDVFTPTTEKEDRMSNVDVETGELLFAGQNGVSRSAGVKTDWSNIAPRIGFAATVRPGLVVRGGYGISYAPMNYASGHLMKNVPHTASWSALLPGSWVSPPDPVAPDPETWTGDWGGGAVDLNFKSDRVHQFNLMVEKEFAGNVLNVGYVGSIGQRMMSEIPDINVPAPGPGAINPRRPLYAMNSALGSIGNYYTNRGVSNYNALQVGLTRRMQAGLTASIHYTWAHALNDIRNVDSGGTINYAEYPDQIRKYDYGNADTDMRHKAVVTLNYQLPFGKSAEGLAKVLLADWQVNILGFYQSGLPLSFGTAGMFSNIHTRGGDRADRVPGVPITVDNPTLERWFNTDAFTTPEQYTTGDAGRNILAGPPQRRIDLSIFKDIDFGGSRRLQLRAECFNLTNTPSFGAPNTRVDDPNFGRITGGATNPRQIQFAAKFLF